MMEYVQAPKKKRRKQPEESEQIALVDWSKTQELPKVPHIEPGSTVFDYLLAVPNGGKRNLSEAKRLKASGVKAGVSDLFLALPMNEFCGLWIEMKQTDPSKSKVNEIQTKWLVRQRRAGYRTAVCYGFEQAKAVILDYITLNLAEAA